VPITYRSGWAMSSELGEPVTNTQRSSQPTVRLSG
jgi:hypothetical protein